MANNLLKSLTNEYVFKMSDGFEHTLFSNKLASVITAFLYLHGAQILNGIELLTITANGRNVPNKVVKQSTQIFLDENKGVEDLNLEMAMDLVDSIFI